MSELTERIPVRGSSLGEVRGGLFIILQTEFHLTPNGYMSYGCRPQTNQASSTCTQCNRGKKSSYYVPIIPFQLFELNLVGSTSQLAYLPSFHRTRPLYTLQCRQSSSRHYLLSHSSSRYSCSKNLIRTICQFNIWWNRSSDSSGVQLGYSPCGALPSL